MDSRIDTIFALSSAPGRAGVSVFRISGPKALTFLDAITLGKRPPNRRAVVRKIIAQTDDGIDAIDDALVITMQGPKSFTGEDCVEIHCHGSFAVIDAISALLLSIGAQQAEAGAFTRRAVLNGRMDLTEAEGLADLIDAETRGQRQQALRQMQGGLRATYEAWREELIQALAFIEGEIDFPDEGDMPVELSLRAKPHIINVKNKMETTLSNAERGERVRSGLDIVIIGRPNSGKSSLINRLARNQAAIVSDIAGTTRDIIDIQMAIGGLPVRLSDTAGLRKSEDVIEREGVRRAVERAAHADIRLFLHDVSCGDWQVPEGIEPKRGDALILNKIDLRSDDQATIGHMTEPRLERLQPFWVSVKNDRGVEAFEDWLEAQVIARFAPSQTPGLTRLRHAQCVRTAITALSRAEQALMIGAELAGEDIRTALQAISELAGEADMEAVFDQIFLRFCIGK